MARAITQQGAPDEGWRQAAQQALARAGFRSTLPRRLMLEWIAAVNGPFSAEALVQELDRRRSGTRATVYRFIDWLREHGWLARVHSDDARHAYVRRRPGHQHQAICSGCGATLTLDGCGIEDLVMPALIAAGFELHGHVLELHGLCRRCSQDHSGRQGQAG